MLDNLLIAIRCVAPIIIGLFVGILVRRTKTMSESSLRQTNRLLFDFLFPMYLFYITYQADFDTAFSLRLILLGAAMTTLYFFGGLVVLHRRGYSNRQIGALSQNAFRSNLNIIALPLAESMLGAPGLASMAIISAFLTPIYNIYAVTTLEMHRDGGKVDLKKILIGIARNHLVIGTLLGFVFHFARIPLPAVVLSSIQAMGKAGTTVALILLGASFSFKGLISDRKPIIEGVLFRLIFAPLFAFLLALLLGFNGEEQALIVVAMGAPVATVSFTMCQAYDSDADLAAELVVTTSTFCCFSLFFWIFVMKQMGII